MAKHSGKDHLRIVPPEGFSSHEATIPPIFASVSRDVTKDFLGVSTPPNTFGANVSIDAPDDRGPSKARGTFTSQGGLYLPDPDTKRQVPPELTEAYDRFYQERRAAPGRPDLETPGELRYFPRHLAPPDVH